MPEVEILVTLCGDAAATCASLPGPWKAIPWDLPDPARATGSKEEILAVFRKVRDEIGRRIDGLVAELGEAGTARPLHPPS
jgi:arsenate reductase